MSIPENSTLALTACMHALRALAPHVADPRAKSAARQQFGNPRTDPFRRRLDVPVGGVHVSKGHRGIAVAKQPGHDRQRNALDHALARVRMTTISCTR